MIENDFMCPLPIRRLGFVKTLWLKSSLAGHLSAAGFADSPVTMWAYRICGATKKDRLFRVALRRAVHSAAGCSVTSSYEALLKAFGEFCEATVILDETQPLGKTRNGVAADVDESVAKTRAYRELIERDALITHFLCAEVHSSPIPCPDYAVLPAKFARLWSADPDVNVVVAGIEKDRNGPWFLGAGANATLDVAIQKAYLESVSIYCGYYYADRVFDQLSERDRLVWTHIASSSSMAMQNNIRMIFEGSGTLQPDFKTSMAAASFTVVANLKNGWKVVRADHGSLCPIAFGPQWEQARHPIIQTLRARNLSPRWDKHPFA
jgi:hypothetical protein